ncbi:MAG TPA: tetratricopeptide repeat protein [Burkholderiaceae bacterium]|nr:tetratricopeptide repeat protein [Burkholderiaceae bacterium]
MSVLNQMLRDLEKRGAMHDLVAAAGTATVARPALPHAQRPARLRRAWLWAAVLGTAAAFVGIHSWLSYRVQEAGTARTPLGARQFASVVAPEATAADSTPATTPTPPVVAAAPLPEPAPTSTPAASRDAPKARAVAERPRRVATAPRSQPIAPPLPKAETFARPVPAEPDVPSIVARSTSDTNRDVDRAADLIARGRATEAMELLVQVLNRQPTNAEARSSLAALLAEAGKREQALHVLLAGSEVDPGRFAIPAAQLQAEMGDLRGALQTLARVPQARRNAAYEALQAGVAQRAGDHMSAIAAYRRALLQPGADAIWWVGLGVSLEATGEPVEARNAYTRAVAEARLPADVRRYASERLAVLDSQSQAIRAANVF